MNSFNNTYFGPLDKKYCNIFYWLTFLYFWMLIILFLLGGLFLFKNKKKVSFTDVLTGIYMFSAIMLNYFVNRLLLTMCNKVL